MKFFSRHSFMTPAPRQRPWHHWSKMAATVVELRSVWTELDHRIYICRVRKGSHIEHV